MCNCRSCKPHRLHAHPNSFNHNIRQTYRSRAKVSPSPPPIPPQPNRFEFDEQIAPYELPEPPPRRYQLVPIRDESPIVTSPMQNLSSFNRSSYDRNNVRQNDYENTRDIIRTPVVKDPRRKPYYYNELNQTLDANGNIQIPDGDLELLNAKHCDEISDDALRNSTMLRGSGGSLDHII